MTQPAPSVPRQKTFEHHTIYPIPVHERHGRVSDLFTVWFSANMTLLTVVTGALAPVVFGLSLVWSVLAIVLGNMAGAVFMALHAAQGPQLGVPQMVQSRGQFGLYGSVPVIVLVILMYMGFAASNCVVGGEALTHVVPALGRTGSIVLVAFLTLVPCAMGYRTIHLCSKVASWISAAAVLLALVCTLRSLSPGLLGNLHGSVAGFFGAFSVAALWQIAYAPYVSDSSRYLPPTQRAMRLAFGASYGGSVIGAVLPMILGSLLALQWPGLPVAAALADATGPLGGVILLVLALAIPLANAMSVYCGTLCSLTFVQTFRPAWHFGMPARLGTTVALLALALLMSLGMADDFLKAYTSFLDVLMAILVPWTAINLTDYYLLRHGEYDVAAFFAPDGGRYGRINVAAMVCYLIGVAVELPFLHISLYTGWAAHWMRNVDLSWLVSLTVTSLIYWLWMRRAASAQALLHSGHAE
ncbi:purine-cytosine permease family protein [Oecophyllibacter saccharovorans]|uniref:Cytosine permease n=1 Tax=Oecophyllibacter saccharovorans TaxID=2558360 RepID=A0A506URS5_9PROT|nr:cytosine permease [Oecophyllibacter saccharovorans]TPW35062.1 cytosine permease [Oecophyllibacter saccharovorans]TPW36012.1 cytosine permease [Oecophyllibacter saccharovorans]